MAQRQYCEQAENLIQRTSECQEILNRPVRDSFCPMCSPHFDVKTASWIFSFRGPYLLRSPSSCSAYKAEWYKVFWAHALKPYCSCLRWKPAVRWYTALGAPLPGSTRSKASILAFPGVIFYSELLSQPDCHGGVPLYLHRFPLPKTFADTSTIVVYDNLLHRPILCPYFLLMVAS